MFVQILEEMLTLIGGLIVAYFIYVFISRKDDKSATSTTNMAQMALKELVERVVEEAKKLPGLRSSEAEKEKEQSISDRSYEDLLATAILNKVIEKFQNDYVDGNRNILHEKSSNRYTNSEIETGLETRGQEEGSSSLEPLSQDECGSDCGQHVDHSQPLSLTIEERIEEVTTTYASDEGINNDDENDLDFRNTRRVPFPEYGMDIIDPLQDSSDESQEESFQDLVTPIESWEENWLFQKRKIQARSEPVAMLVPNASADYRALIGDQNAEDTSDLSECSVQSDEEIEQELKFVISNVVSKYTHSEKELKSLQLENFEKTCISENPEISGKFLKNRNHVKIDDNRSHISEAENTKERGLRKLEKQNSRKEEESLDRRNTTEEISRKEPSIKDTNQNFEKERNNIKVVNKSKTPNIEPCEEKDVKILEYTLQNSSQVNGNTIKKTELSNGVISSVGITDKQSLDKSVNKKEEKGVIIELPNLPESKDSEVVKYKISIPNDHHRIDGEEEVQQESEYTEHYDTATQKHMDSLTKVYGPMGIDEVDEVSEISLPPRKNLGKCRESAAFIKGERTSPQSCTREKKIDDKNQFSTPPRPGTIAEREHKKWENAPPIENNPYSEENIQKRLLERQYSRRSEISGSNVSKSTGKPIQIVLGAKHLDVKRFGRDYYINDSLTSNGERQREVGINTRSASSLSQHSNSGSDREQQNYDLKPLSSPEEEKLKFSSWQKNNELKDETNEFHSLDSKNSTSEVTDCFNSDVIVPSKHWENSEVENFLEEERRNNKNEVNARLNNQESGNAHESISDEKNKKIRRLDLRAYGFENDFRFKRCETAKSSPQRVVNKLDLKSFGYECGLRRTQSIQLDSRNHSNNPKPKITRAKNKSNLTERSEIKSHEDNFDLTQSTEDLNRGTYQDGTYFAIRGMFSAKSVPNITDSQLYENGTDVNMMRCKYEKKSKFTLTKDKTEEERRTEIRNRTKEKKSSSSLENILIQSEAEKSEDDNSDNSIPLLPSVRRLAEAYSKSTERLNPQKVLKSSNKLEKERPTTPEIHLVETPRQMHSLTARSLSKEFREGLRQIPQKVISPPASHGKLEQKTFENQTNTENERQSLIGDISIISPGNLKNNIQFWEELQKQH